MFRGSGKMQRRLNHFLVELGGSRQQATNTKQILEMPGVIFVQGLLLQYSTIADELHDHTEGASCAAFDCSRHWI